MDTQTTNGAQSRLILSTAIDYQEYLTDYAVRTGLPNPVFTRELDVLVAEQHALLVISDLSSATQAQIEPILKTPIVFLGKENELRQRFPNAQTLDEAIETARTEFNIHTVAVLAQNHDKEITEAYELKQQWLALFKQLTQEQKEQLLQGKYDPPRFLALFGKTQKIFSTEPQITVQSVADPDDMQALLVSAMRAYDEQPNEENTERAKRRVIAFQNNFTPTLGESQVGDGGARRIGRVLRNYGEMSWRISRTVTDKRKEIYVDGETTYETLSHRDIAEQRYNDSRKFFKDNRFNTPVILRPLDLGDNGSFILMQDIEGPTLDHALRKISDELAKGIDNKRKVLLRSVRSELVRKAINDIAVWQTSAPKTFMSKQSKMVLPGYKNRIGAVTDVLSRATDVFSDEELTLLLYSHDILDSLDYSAKNIVRVRDAAMQNYVIQFDSVKFDPQTGMPNFSIDDLLRNTTTEKDGKAHVDPDKIERKVFNVDLAYHWGHVMEDLAHLITAPEYPYFADKKTRKQHIAAFFENTGRSDLTEDETSQEIIAYFRSARKIVLNAITYTNNVTNELARGEISLQHAQKRKRKIDANIRKLAETCREIARTLYNRNKRENDDSKALAEIKSFYTSPFTSETAQIMAMVGNGASEMARQAIHALTIYKIYEKFANYLQEHDVTRFEGKK